MSEIKMFNKWSFDGVSVSDPGLKPYVNLKPITVPKTGGKYNQKKFHKSKMNIVERHVGFAEKSFFEEKIKPLLIATETEDLEASGETPGSAQ